MTKGNLFNKVTAHILICAACLSLTGCGGFSKAPEKGIKDMTPDDYEPAYFLTEEELPEDAFYIVKNAIVKQRGKDGRMTEREETHYLPLLFPAANYTDRRSAPAGYDPERITWVNYNLDEGLIPTMSARDRMIYKSSTMIPTKYALEKFFDDGYTLGVCGLYRDMSGNYRYVSHDNDGKGWTMPQSDATGFDGLEADSIYFASVGETRVTPLNVSTSGTVTGLELMETYPCDIRTGTEKVSADLTCNIHMFSSAETYMFGSFTFITDIIAQINIPDYAPTGYYTIGDGGFFRYVADEHVDDWKRLKAADYNGTIYTYSEDGQVNGTSSGLLFDGNGFLVRALAGEKEAAVSPDRKALSYEETVRKKKTASSISIPTKRSPDDSGIYSGPHKVKDISDPVISGSTKVYSLTAEAEDMDETLMFRYVQTASRPELVKGHAYYITFKEADGGFDGYEILSAAEHSGRALSFNRAGKATVSGDHEGHRRKVRIAAGTDSKEGGTEE